MLTVSGISKPSISPGTTDYVHAVGNRLTESTGAVAKTYSHDAHGNIVSDGTRTFVYNQNNRLIRVTEGAVTLGEYFYDAFGRRVKKVASGVTTLYHYDVVGNLIAETTADGTPLRDIVYMNGERVAMKLYGSQAGWYFFVNDHLGTPQKIIDSAGQVMWAGFYLPFGKAWAYPATITNNFRFPGQYYDAETGLHYNWHRYYDPDTGRYLTPDPIGLEGGINLYAYSLNNPANFTDMLGLDTTGGIIYDEGGNIIDEISIQPQELMLKIAAMVTGARGIWMVIKTPQAVKQQTRCRVQSRINIAKGRTRFTPKRDTGESASAGFDHVLKQHFNRAAANNRSVFSVTPDKLKQILQRKSVVRSPVKPMGNGMFSRIADAGEVVGSTALNHGGKATTRIRIITDSAGNLITTYPVP